MKLLSGRTFKRRNFRDEAAKQVLTWCEIHPTEFYKEDILWRRHHLLKCLDFSGEHVLERLWIFSLKFVFFFLNSPSFRTVLQFHSILSWFHFYLLLNCMRNENKIKVRTFSLYHTVPGLTLFVQSTLGNSLAFLRGSVLFNLLVFSHQSLVNSLNSSFRNAVTIGYVLN